MKSPDVQAHKQLINNDNDDHIFDCGCMPSALIWVGTDVKIVTETSHENIVTMD